MTQLEFVKIKLGIKYDFTTMQIGEILSKVFVIAKPRTNGECQRLFAIFKNAICKVHPLIDFNLTHDKNKKFNHLIPKQSEKQMFSIGSEEDRAKMAKIRNPKYGTSKPVKLIDKIQKANIATPKNRVVGSGVCKIVKHNQENKSTEQHEKEILEMFAVLEEKPKSDFYKRYKTTQDFYDSIVWKKLRRKVLLTYGSKCMCCGATPDKAIICVDHIRPISKHPELAEDFDNLQVLCESCNCGKMADDETDHRP